MRGVTTPFRREDELEESLLPPPTWPPMAPPEDGRFGTASISPDGPVVAGSSGTWTLTYTAGRFGVDDGGAIRIALHTISDWGSPQLADPQAADYWRVSWTLPSPGRIVASFDGDLGVRPWKRVVTLRVRDQAMRPGDQVTVTIGDRRRGSPGAQAQTFAGRMRFQVLLDAYGTGIFVPVAAPALEIVAGPADHLRVHAPSDAVVGESAVVTASVLDRWGNVLRHWQETRQLAEPGVQTVWVEDRESGLRGESNPIRVRVGRSPYPNPLPLGEGIASPPPRGGLPEGEGTGYKVFWGDLHAQTEETIGSGTLDEYFSFARDSAAVDFVGHQGNDFQITAPVWRQIMAKTQRYDAANAFVTFAGYEWSGNTPGGGDHNVHFRGGAGQRYDLHRSGHWQVADQSDAASDRFPAAGMLIYASTLTNR
jgi:hypothetical protein